MDMVAIDKKVRGISLWREDVIKFKERVKNQNLSTFLRNYLHAQMEKYTLSKAGKRTLEEEMQAALIRRGRKHPNAPSVRSYCLAYSQPEKIVGRGRFVAEPKAVKGGEGKRNAANAKRTQRQ